MKDYTTKLRNLVGQGTLKYLTVQNDTELFGEYQIETELYTSNGSLQITIRNPNYNQAARILCHIVKVVTKKDKRKD